MSRPKRRITDRLRRPDGWPFPESAFWRCEFTGEWVDESEVVGLPACIPQCKSLSPAAPTAEARRLHKERVRAFQELVDQNCNTCRYLERLPHEKSDTLMRGRCLKEVGEGHPYGEDGFGVFAFHPDDYMGMECHELRPVRNPD